MSIWTCDKCGKISETTDLAPHVCPPGSSIPMVPGSSSGNVAGGGTLQEALQPLTAIMRDSPDYWRYSFVEVPCVITGLVIPKEMLAAFDQAGLLQGVSGLAISLDLVGGVQPTHIVITNEMGEHIGVVGGLWLKRDYTTLLAERALKVLKEGHSEANMASEPEKNAHLQLKKEQKTLAKTLAKTTMYSTPEVEHAVFRLLNAGFSWTEARDVIEVAPATGISLANYVNDVIGASKSQKGLPTVSDTWRVAQALAEITPFSAPEIDGELVRMTHPDYDMPLIKARNIIAMAPKSVKSLPDYVDGVIYTRQQKHSVTDQRRDDMKCPMCAGDHEIYPKGNRWQCACGFYMTLEEAQGEFERPASIALAAGHEDVARLLDQQLRGYESPGFATALKMARIRLRKVAERAVAILQSRDE